MNHGINQKEGINEEGIKMSELTASGVDALCKEMALIRDEGIQEKEKKLYDLANKIVGNVGEPTNCAISVTGEQYITYNMKFPKNYNINKWFDSLIWCKVSECKSEKPCIYWRVRPEIKITKTGYELYTRFLISSESQMFTKYKGEK
jgi:hypothetical protein